MWSNTKIVLLKLNFFECVLKAFGLFFKNFYQITVRIHLINVILSIKFIILITKLEKLIKMSFFNNSQIYK